MKNKFLTVLVIFAVIFVVMGAIAMTSSISGPLLENNGGTDTETDGVGNNSGGSSNSKLEEYTVSFWNQGTCINRITVTKGGSFYVPDLPVTFPTGGDYVLDYWRGSDGKRYDTGRTYSNVSQSITLTTVFKLRDATDSGEPETCSHNYSYVITQTATCKSVEVRKYTCSSCGDSYISEGPIFDATNHMAWHFEKIDDSYHYCVCNYCGTVIRKEAHGLCNCSNDEPVG